jgi:hypothetical protein
MLTSEYVSEGKPTISRSERIHSMFRPLIIAYHGIADAITGANGIKEDFLKIYANNLVIAFNANSLMARVSFEMMTVKEKDRVYELAKEPLGVINNRLNKKLGNGLLYAVAKKLHS